MNNESVNLTVRAISTEYAQTRSGLASLAQGLALLNERVRQVNEKVRATLDVVGTIGEQTAALGEGLAGAFGVSLPAPVPTTAPTPTPIPFRRVEWDESEDTPPEVLEYLNGIHREESISDAPVIAQEDREEGETAPTPTEVPVEAGRAVAGIPVVKLPRTWDEARKSVHLDNETLRVLADHFDIRLKSGRGADQGNRFAVWQALKPHLAGLVESEVK